MWKPASNVSYMNGGLHRRATLSRDSRRHAPAPTKPLPTPQLPLEMDVTQCYIVSASSPTSTNANCRCDEGVQLRSAQLVSVQRVNKTGNRDVLLANTRRVLASPNVVFLHASEEKHDCRQCVKPYDANERDASGDGLKWVDCENDGCSAWFCPTCAPDEEAVPSHLHLSSSSIAMSPPLDRRCRRRKRSSFCITNDSYSIDNNSPPSNDDNSQPATTIRNQR
jgi:hypothetical protein